MRALNTEETKNLLCFSKRTAGRVEPDGERPDRRRRPLTLPTFKIRRLKRLSEQFLIEHRHQNQRTAHFSNWLKLTVPPISADTVADDARTAAKTARKHLNTLADEGFVETIPGEHGGTLYRRSPESLVVEQAADILDHVSTDELVTRIQEMREQLTKYQSEFDVNSLEELTVTQTNQALAESESGSPQDEINSETIREWKTLRRNLAFANAALSIGNAEKFVDSDRRSTDDSVPA